ncbi:MAG: UvrB/UvrC motif-containing protein, partial [Brevibacterium yomogidense]
EFDYGKGKRGFNATITDEQRAAFERSKSDGAPLAPPAEDLVELIASLTDQMHAAAADLQFELAARLRDELGDLKRELRQMKEAGHA